MALPYGYSPRQHFDCSTGEYRVRAGPTPTPLWSLGAGADDLMLSPRQFPSVTKVEDEDEKHITPRRVMANLESFSLMIKHGARMGDALKALFTGKRMTEVQAAICIQAFWRRHRCLASHSARLAAARVIQRAYHRAMRRRESKAATLLQRVRRGGVSRAEARRLRAARAIQNAFRQRLARRQLAHLRAQKRGLKRSFSWGRRAAARPPADVGAASRAQLSRRVASFTLGRRLQRSASFDRAVVSARVPPRPSADAAEGTDTRQANTMAARRLELVCYASARGLGLELDMTNTVTKILPGSAAEAQGLVQIQDTVIAVDGQPLRGKLLKHALVPGRSKYTLRVQRVCHFPAEDKSVRQSSWSMNLANSSRCHRFRRSSSFGRHH
ncbi:hypothetical protein AB1Y20_020325 [Prymnesium parvum]|uniref:PDZ domain-containing protein n=1 Tax=Prymnesium parvum TaxID=97485 RepID=A0AB34JT33_PRYPA